MLPLPVMVSDLLWDFMLNLFDPRCINHALLLFACSLLYFFLHPLQCQVLLAMPNEERVSLTMCFVLLLDLYHLTSCFM